MVWHVARTALHWKLDVAWLPSAHWDDNLQDFQSTVGCNMNHREAQATECSRCTVHSCASRYGMVSPSRFMENVTVNVQQCH